MIIQNSIILAKYSFSATAEKVFLKMVSMVDKNDKDFKPYTLSVKRLLDEIGTKNREFYTMVKNVVDDLVDIKLKIENDKEYITYALFIKCVYLKNQGAVVFHFHPEVKPFFLNLKKEKGYTKLNIKYSLQLRSWYHIRIYNILKTSEFKKKTTFTVDRLRELLDLKDKYSEYKNFKNRLLLPAQIKIKEKTDIYFLFEEFKIGRKVNELLFRIYAQNPPKKKKKTEEVTSMIFDKNMVIPKEDKAQEIIKKFIFPKDQDYIKNTFSDDYIIFYYSHCVKLQNAGVIKRSFNGFLYKSLNSDSENYKVRKIKAYEAKERKKKEKVEEQKVIQQNEDFYNDSVELFEKLSIDEKEIYYNKVPKVVKGSNLFENKNGMACIYYHEERMKEAGKI